MSIIESAYLKASKNKRTDSEEVEKLVQAEKAVSEKRVKDPESLGSARLQISNMSQDQTFTAAEFAEKGLISPHMKDTMLLNKYRNLRTRLLAANSKDNFVTLVTSVISDTDTSLIATNLAAAFALDEGKTSLLIDANINNPAQNKILDVDVDNGLIDYLESDSSDFSDIIYKTNIPRLRLLPSGNIRVSAAEYFTSVKMKGLINEVVSRYPERFPIIDAPSITRSADTRILLEFCDSVLLVVPYGKCSKEEIKYAAAAIGSDKLSGIISYDF